MTDPVATQATPPAAHSYEVVRETWLTLKPRSRSSAAVAGIATLFLALGSFIFLFDVGGAGQLMAASPESVFAHHQYWRLWTSLFAHGDFGHIASNTLLFYILGFFLHAYFGSRLFPIGALFFGGVINLLTLTTYDPEVSVIGASGVVYWMGGVWLVLYFFLSRQKNLSQRWLRTLGVAILIFMPTGAFEHQVSYRTHFIGFVIGIAVGVWHFYRHRKRFLAAEVRETLFDDDDDAPEHLPVISVDTEKKELVGDFKNASEE